MKYSANSFSIATLFFISLFFSTNLPVKADELINAEFEHLSTEHGLSQKTVQSIIQDHNGFLWLGTQEGLNRYDGKKLKVFRHLNNDKTSLSNDYIRDIISDKSGGLWIATQAGLNQFIETNETFKRIEIRGKKENGIDRLNTLFEDSTGSIWIGTDGNGLFKLDQAEGNIKVSSFKIFKKLENTDVRVIFEDSRGRMWVGTNGKGIFLINSDKNKIKTFYQSPSESKLRYNRIRSIIEDHRGQIWIGSRGGGISRFNELSETFTYYHNDAKDAQSLSSNRVYQIFEDNQQRLWIATDGGLNIFQPEENNFVRIQHKASQLSSLSNNRVLSIFQDDGNLLWFGTQSGLNQWNPITAKFVHYRHTNDQSDSLAYNYIHGFSESNDGTLYIATYGGGLDSFNPKKKVFEAPVLPLSNGKKIDNHLTTLLVDNQENLWIGTLSQGVYVYSLKSKKLINFDANEAGIKKLSANGVTDILQDSDNEIWVSTYRGGLNRLKKSRDGFTHYRLNDQQNGLTNENIFQVIEDDEGYIWITTDGGGIFKLDKNTGKFNNFSHIKKNPTSLSGNNVTSIYQDTKGRFWIGTQGNGLNRWSAKDRRRGTSNFKHYTIENGLNSSTVNGTIEDGKGFIWISTNRGVSRLNPATDEIKNYNLADEIHGNEFNVGALHKSADNRLYFGGLEGISAFYPSEIIENKHLPKVVLTQITSEGREVKMEQPLSHLTQVTFDHQDYLISFEFAALDFSQPSKNNYQYKLEGLDEDWINLGVLNRATFTNLPSGSFLLKVRGSNNDGIWSDEAINLQVIVKPAPWASWWAFVIYSLLFGAALILVIRSQANRIAKQELFQKHVSDEIQSKTALFEKDNLSLKEQVKSYQYNSGNDLATGLPNQSFFTEQLIISLDWLRKIGVEDSDQKLCCLIVKLSSLTANPSTTDSPTTNPSPTNLATTEPATNIDSRLTTLAENISRIEPNIHLIARWNTNELALLCFAKNGKQISEIAKNICMADGGDKICMGYTLAPLRINDPQSFQWETVLMLSEHTMRSACKQADTQVIGLTASHQALSGLLIKDVMKSENILSMKDVFEFNIF